MKCEHCGKNEATFYCRSNVNGKISQVHLCSDCASALGYTQSFRRSFRPMSFFGDDFFSRPFALLDDLMESRLLTEFPAPAEDAGIPAAEAENAALVSDAEREKLQRQRRRNALENQLKFAVEQEDFETAIRLRDELKTLRDEKNAS